MIPSIWQAGRNRIQQILGPRRHRLIPWAGMEVLTACLVSEIMVPVIVLSCLQLAGWGSVEVSNSEAPRDPLGRIRLSFWTNVLSLPLQVGLILLMIHQACGARPFQLGLYYRRGLNQLWTALLATAILTPLVLLLNLLVNSLYQHFTGVQPTLHPFFKLKGQMTGFDCLGLLLAVIVAAPVLEELLLRGLLQPWLGTKLWGGPLAVCLAFVVAILKRDQNPAGLLTIQPLEGNSVVNFLLPFQPAIFILLMAPLLTLCKPGPGQAIFGTALLFGALHSSVWPSPVALFLLGLGLGWLAWRTQGIVVPILVHAFFNAIGCLEFVVGFS